jgi:histidinol-phosphatase
MLLACERDGEPRSGPRAGARRTLARPAAVVPGRSRCPGTSIHVSSIDDLERTQLFYSSLTDAERVEGAGLASPRRWRSRGFGDFWGYALVARARRRRWSVGVSAWDLAAPVVLVEEAGGRFTDLDGERRIDTRTMLVSNGVLHDVILESLRRTG